MTFKAFITKYALTRGILEEEVTQNEKYPHMVSPVKHEYTTYHGEGIEWHRTKEAAIKRAEEMRLNKIKLVKKQLNKLENMRW